MHDIIVIGKGPAGISAAVYAKRASRDVIIIAYSDGALEKAAEIENYYGFDKISGKELLEKGQKQAERLNIPIIQEQVVSLEKEEIFTVKTDKNTYTAKKVLLATGKSRAGVAIKGFNDLRGKGISFCAVCDGFFYRGKNIALIGSGEYAATEYEDLLKFTNNVTVFTNESQEISDKFPKDTKFVHGKISQIIGTDKVESIMVEDESYAVDGIFVAIGTASAADFALKMGVVMNGNNIAVNEKYMTNIEGLYAAGDCIGGFLQISKAVADGALASIDLIK